SPTTGRWRWSPAGPFSAWSRTRTRGRRSPSPGGTPGPCSASGSGAPCACSPSPPTRAWCRCERAGARVGRAGGGLAGACAGPAIGREWGRRSDGVRGAMSGPALGWDDLVTVALVGTERRPLAALAAPDGTELVEPVADTDEGRVL